ncbi:MAG: DUF480 domain-containing protein [Actinomycetota bacterium]
MDDEPSAVEEPPPFLELGSAEARVLGALMEKALTTPQHYPLSLNALVSACNQTTSRDPITALGESEVVELIDQLKARGLARLVHPRSGRGVVKYRHVVDEALAIDEAGVALLGVLLLRGPQTINELRSRTERAYPFDDAATVESVLSFLADRYGRSIVRRLDREPGAREPRWIQLICSAQGEDRASGSAAAEASTVEATAAVPHSAPAAGGPAAAAVTAGLVDDVAELRRELAELRAEFDALKADLGA